MSSLPIIREEVKSRYNKRQHISYEASYTSIPCCGFNRFNLRFYGGFSHEGIQSKQIIVQNGHKLGVGKLICEYPGHQGKIKTVLPANKQLHKCQADYFVQFVSI